MHLSPFKIAIFLISTLQQSIAYNTDVPIFRAIFGFFYGDGFGASNRTSNIANLTLSELGQSRGHCQYDFLPFIAHWERKQCARDDFHIQHLLQLLNQEVVRKPTIMVKCLQPDPFLGNVTQNDSKLYMLRSTQDITTFLKPIGNGTKRHELGACAVLLFWTKSSLACAHVAQYASSLPYLFPTLRVGAIDAFDFPNYNTEYGIIGLPTLLLFHQGRPIVKFYSDAGTFAEFVSRHTGLQPAKTLPPNHQMDHPLPMEPVEETDYNLYMAWIFNIVCAFYFFSKSNLYKQILEMIKRNWRESGAHLER